MKSILLLVDLSPTASISTNQAISLAKLKGATITLCYIAHNQEEANSSDLATKLEPYRTSIEKAGLQPEVHIGIGEYKKEITDYVKINRPDLVIVGTHGKKGLKQNLFGSNIYALIKSISAGTLILSDHTTAKEAGFSKILLPLAAHDNYLLKVKQSCELLASNGKILLFNIVKPGADMSDAMSKNLNLTKEFLSEEGISFELTNHKSEMFSIGYAKETLSYAEKNGVDLISIMTKVAENSGGVASDNDKETIILNTAGIPVLSAND